jgi:hypothetical protein
MLCRLPGTAAALSITPDMDEDTRARIRREKNRVAARKCRAKKMAFMVELQKTLRELMRKNEEYRLQVCLAYWSFTVFSCSYGLRSAELMVLMLCEWVALSKISHRLNVFTHKHLWLCCCCCCT